MVGEYFKKTESCYDPVLLIQSPLDDYLYLLILSLLSFSGMNLNPEFNSESL